MKSQETTRLVVLDALRAIAVVAVVLFHSFPAWVPGGFVGVDIFFLISGFIIWLQYGEKLVSGETRWRTFFARRVRRLVPAYLVVLIATTAAAYYVLPPDLLLEYGQSLFAQAFYLQNFVFLAQGDYFVDPLQRPLLHTWSLAVEEQFYLLFIVPIVLRKWSRRFWPVALIAFGLISLAFAMVTAHYSDRAAFFLLPSRAWEFAAGIGAALLYQNFRKRSAPRAIPAIAIGAVALILISIFRFAEHSPFPGLHSALALTGAFILCVVQGQVGATFTAAASTSSVQHVGKISYSWYLWHWPLISLYAVWSGQPITGTLGGILLVAGYLLAVVSYIAVEQPSHRSSGLKRPLNTTLLLVGFVTFSGAAGAWLINSDGAIGRYPVSDRPYIEAKFDRPGERCPIIDRLFSFNSSVCSRNKIRGDGGVLLLGDSHSNMLREVFTELGTEAVTPVFVSTNICRPIETGKMLCPSSYWKRLEKGIADNHIATVFIVVSWPLDFEEDDFRYAIDRLRSVGVRVFVMKPIPQNSEFDPSIYIGNPKAQDLSQAVTFSEYGRDTYLGARKKHREILDRIGSRDRSVRIIDPAPYLCPKDKCIFAVEGRPTYADANHLSAAGVALIRQELRKVFDDAPPAPIVPARALRTEN